jgi:hypothetical protein
MPFHRIIFVVLPLLLSAFLSGCGDPLKDKILQQTPITAQRIEALGQALENGKVRNANLIYKYARTVAEAKPQLANLVDEFKKEAGRKGPMYLALQDRLNTIERQPHMFANNAALYEELINLYQAADPVLYSDALSDPLNVLADMSDGQLPRVNALSKAQSMQANNAQDFGVGEQLIGNPSYGSWQTGSSGTSFWAWYGMYSMMDNIFGSRRVQYSDWGRSRNYSYYNDYGRTRYSSPTQLKRQTDLDNRTRKSFERRGQKYNSAYSKNKTGSSSLSSKSKTAQSSANKFRSTTSSNLNKSSYANKTSSGSSSFRDSRTSTSRGMSRGK